MTSLSGRVPSEGEFTAPLRAAELAGLPQAVFCRCACGCRFRWPNDARHHEQRTDTGALVEVFELSECPACGSTHRCSLAGSSPDADGEQPVDVVKLVAAWFARRDRERDPGEVI